MSSSNGGFTGLMLRLIAVCALGGLTAACFQPMYAEQTIGGAPGLKQAMSQVDIDKVIVSNPQIDNRLGVELYNALSWQTAGGPGQLSSPRYRLKTSVSSTRVSVVVDVTTARPELENYGINASYELLDLATNKIVVKDQTFSRVSYDIPGQQQRFAKARALKDAEDRAVQVIAEQIRNRLASYLVART
jgi:LPS-assembly lipoprotein